MDSDTGVNLLDPRLAFLLRSFLASDQTCTCHFPKAQAFPHHEEGVCLDMGQESLVTHCTTKPDMPLMQQRIPPFSSYNRERTVMQNLLWDQATCPPPPKTTGFQCIRSLSRSTIPALPGLAGDTGNTLAEDTELQWG